MQTLEVRRDDFATTRVVEAEDPVAGDGEAVLEIERFGLTANNVTYAVVGDLIGYWRFFPVAGEDGWGRVPGWGVARVTASRSDALAEGARLFGYLPMGTHLVITPREHRVAGREAVLDAAAHRAELPGVYNAYDPAPEDHVNETVILRPLFYTAMVLDTAMAQHGAEQIVVSSASARTASAFAFFAAQRDVAVVGLTSLGNVDWVRSLGVYDEVLSYEEVDGLAARPSVYVEIAGNTAIRDRVHRRLGDLLRHSAAVGVTHQDDKAFTPSGELPGPQPEPFFAPAHRPDRDPEQAWGDYCDWTEGWLSFAEVDGVEAAAEAWGRVLAGEVPPSEGTVVVPA